MNYLNEFSYNLLRNMDKNAMHPYVREVLHVALLELGYKSVGDNNLYRYICNDFLYTAIPSADGNCSFKVYLCSADEKLPEILIDFEYCFGTEEEYTVSGIVEMIKNAFEERFTGENINEIV